MDATTWNYPNQLMDDDGYPTQETLDYIKNWSMFDDNNETKIGEFFGKGKYDELIEFIKTIWVYKDAITYENGLLEIHTLGWSGNEDIIYELKKTDLWLIKFRCKQTGGHYYFKIDSESEWDFTVEKYKTNG
jgi:hypothetical protein